MNWGQTNKGDIKLPSSSRRCNLHAKGKGGLFLVELWPICYVIVRKEVLFKIRVTLMLILILKFHFVFLKDYFNGLLSGR